MSILLHTQPFTHQTHVFSFENLSVSTDLENRRQNLVIIYRLPGSCNAFFDELQAFLISLPLDFIMSGDFNISFGNGSSDAVAMNNILDIRNIR